MNLYFEPKVVVVEISVIDYSRVKSICMFHNDTMMVVRNHRGDFACLFVLHFVQVINDLC